MTTSAKGFTGTAKLLLKVGADVNLINPNGNTALLGVSVHAATFCENLDAMDYFGCSRILLRFGSKINIKNRQSENALEHFLTFHRAKSGRDICQLLFAAGETLDGIPDEKIPDCLKFDDVKLELKHICREAIRKHLLSLDPHTHLFGRTKARISFFTD